MSIIRLKMHKPGYLPINFRTPKRNSQDSAQNNGVEQHSEQPGNPSSQQQNKRKLKGIYVIVSDQWLNSLKHFLLVTLPHMVDIILITTYQELQSYGLTPSLLLT